MPSVGAVTSNLNVVSKTAAYTAVANDFVLVDASSGTVTVTMPSSPVLNAMVAVKKTDSSTNAVTVLPGGTANLNGDTSALLVVMGATATFQYDGTNWQLLSTSLLNTANAVAGLPVGGTADQVLKKNTGANYDVGWTTVSAGGGGGFLHPWASGQNRIFVAPPITSGTTNATISATTNAVFFPIRIPAACTISSMIVFVGTGGYSSLLMYASLYTDTVYAAPGTRLATATANPNASAYNSSAFTFNYVVPNAMNAWVAYGASGGVPLISHNNQTAPQSFLTQGTATFGVTGTASMYTARSSTSVAGNFHPTDVSSFTFSPSGSYTPVFGFQIG